MFVVIGGALLVLLMSGQTSYLMADVQQQVQQATRQALDQIAREVREAVMLSCGESADTACPTASPRLNFQILRYDPGPPATFTPGSEVANGEFIHYRTFTENNEVLLVRWRTAAANTPNVNLTACTAAQNCRVIARNIESVSFDWDNASNERTVTIQIEASIQNPRLPGSATGTEVRTGRLTTQVQVRHPDPDGPF